MQHPPTPPDAYAHHPELAGRINDPLTSFFRDFQPAQFDAQMAALGHAPDWRFPDDVREAARRDFLGHRRFAEMWVFAYGSLMWDPAILFDLVRKAQVPAHARRFCLVDTFGARGTPDAPGLMAALHTGAGCAGLVFRIPAALADVESERLWRREMVGPGYIAAFVPAETAGGTVQALTFLADPTQPMIQLDLTRDQQVGYIATGAGVLGSSRDYLENIAAQFAVLGITDPEVDDLLAQVRAYTA